MAEQIPVTIRLPKELHDKLRLESFNTRKSQNSIIVEALQAYLKEDE